MNVVYTNYYMGSNKLLELGTSGVPTMLHLLVFLKESVITPFSSTRKILTWFTSHFMLMTLSLPYLLMFYNNLSFHFSAPNLLLKIWDIRATSQVFKSITTKKGSFLSYKKYAKEILTHAKMSSCKSGPTSVDKKPKMSVTHNTPYEE